MSGTNLQRNGVRAAAAAATRERVVDAARELFMGGWYDEVTLRQVAKEAGVALQTVVNHFETKEGLFSAVIAALGTDFQSQRDAVAPGDVAAAAAAVVADYEAFGDATLRALALEDRFDALRAVTAEGRANHRAWVRRTFPAALDGLSDAARDRRLALLVAATDVYTWKLLRRDQGLSRRRTVTAIGELIEALHHQPSEREET